MHFAFALIFVLATMLGGSPVEARERAQPEGFSVVAAGQLYRGGRPTAAHLRALAKLGVKTVVGMQGGDTVAHNPLAIILKAASPGERMSRVREERNLTEALGMHFIWEPMSTIIFYTGKITRHEDDVVDDALAALNDPKNFPIYIHCTKGRDRTGLIIALWRVQHGWSIEAAHQEWVRLGHRGITGLVTHTLDKYYYAKARSLALARNYDFRAERRSVLR